MVIFRDRQNCTELDMQNFIYVCYFYKGRKI